MKFYSKRRPGVTAIVVSALLSFSTPSSAQVDPASHQMLVEKGFNQADFKAAEVTQIGKNYLFYSRWAKCATNASNIALMNGAPDTRAKTLIQLSCNDEAFALRASIATQLGLERANRVTNLLLADMLIRTVNRWVEQHPKAVDGSAQVGDWAIQKLDSGGCTAFVNAKGKEDYIRIIGLKGTLYLLLRTEFPQSPTGSAALGRVIIGRYPAPVVMDGKFKVVDLNGEKWLAAAMSQQDIRNVQNGGTIIIEDTQGSSKEEREWDVRQNKVFDVVQRC